MRRATLMLMVVVALLVAACGSSSKASSPGNATTTTAAGKARPHVTIDAKDFGYTLPAHIPAGWVDVTLHNSGKSLHQIAFAKLGSMSFDAFRAAASATDAKALAGAQFVGGPNNADSGSSVTGTIHLEEGTYGVACFIPDDKDGKTHAEHGMVGQVEVIETNASVEDEPVADGGSITLSEFTFLPNASFTGTGMVAIKNVGVQVHELIVMKENAGKTIDDVKNYLLTPPGTPPPPGQPPFTSAGGVVGLGPHETMYETMALTPGKYVLLCFFPDPNKGNVPHALEGMIKEITIS